VGGSCLLRVFARVCACLCAILLKFILFLGDAGKVYRGRPVHCSTMMIIDLNASEARATHVLDKAMLMECVQSDMTSEHVVEVGLENKNNNF
jgi:hypothetical protein